MLNNDSSFCKTDTLLRLKYYAQFMVLSPFTGNMFIVPVRYGEMTMVHPVTGKVSWYQVPAI